VELLQLLSIANALFIFWLFAQGAIHKLNPANDLYFSSLITEFGWGDIKLASLIAKFVGLVELVVAFAIIYPPTRALAALIAIALLFGYLTHMAYQLYQGRRDLDCGCAGPGAKVKISGQLLVRNTVLIAVTFFCITAAENAASGLWLLGTLLAVIGIIIYLSSEQLIGNAQKLKALRT